LISATREEREESLRAVIRDVLIDPAFNPLSISVSHVRIPSSDDESVWNDTGIVEIHILGLTAPGQAVYYSDVTGADDDAVDPDDIDLDQVEER